MKIGDEPLDAQANYYSKIIESSADSLRDLVENMARLEDVKQALDFKPILGK